MRVGEFVRLRNFSLFSFLDFSFAEPASCFEVFSFRFSHTRECVPHFFFKQRGEETSKSS